MADILQIPLRKYGTQVSPYDSIKANEPIEDLFTMVNIVNAESESNAQVLALAKGSLSSAAERLDVSLNADGTVKAEAITAVPIASVVQETTNQPEDLLIPTRAQLDKLDEVESNANRFAVQVGDGDAFAGTVVLRPGRTVVLTPSRRSDGVIELNIDTIFSGDRIHEHRLFQECKILSITGVALLPNKDDDPVPGSMKVFLNGVMLRRDSFEEYVDPDTRRIVGVRVKEKPESINLSLDSLWFEYVVRPLSSSSARSVVERTRLTVFDHDVEAGDLVNVYLPLGDPSATLYKFWMIKLPEEIVAPYDGLQLFVSEDAYPHVGPSKGLTFRRYGQDWDVVTLSGVRYLRWRYDQTAPVGGPTSGSTYDFLAKIGSGSVADPNDLFAPAPLSTGVRMSLFY